MSRYTLTIVHATCPVGEPLPVPPEIVDLTVEQPKGHPCLELYNAWWERPEDVPLPVTWPESEVYGWGKPATEKYQLFYRVAKIPERVNILDRIPPESRVRLRLGGKGIRYFQDCTAAEAMGVLRTMVVEMVREWGTGPDDPAKAYHANPGWEFLAQSVMWIELPNGLDLRWTPWGDSDEDGGHSLEPNFETLAVNEVILRDVQIEYLPALVYHTRMVALLQGFFNLFPTAAEAR